MLSEKLYKLRRRSGLSQEQLAEQLNVSRQAISKWEQGTAIPENSKLVAISDYFGVTVDFLLKDDTEDTANTTKAVADEKPKMMAGLIICITGVVSMIVWGLLSVFSPKTSHHLSDSSVINIDGNGIFLILCVAAIVAGAGLLLKNKKE